VSLPKVLQSIKNSDQAPKPFPISKQYKARSKKGDTTQDHDDDNGDDDDAGHAVEGLVEKPAAGNKGQRKLGKNASKKKGQPKKKLKAKVKVQKESGSYVPAEYAAKRKAFIKRLRDDGHSYQIANSTWAFSAERCGLLSGLSVSELKRRRFLPKGATENPWAK